MAQPYSAFAKMLLERQHYPDIRPYPGAPAQRPYDVTAHTLPLLLGVDVMAVPSAFTADLEPVDRDGRRARPRSRAAGPGWPSAIARGDLVALGRLLRARVPVRWATADFTDGGRRFPAGTLLVPASARARVPP